MPQTTEGCLGASLPGNKMATFLEHFFMSNLEREEADGSRDEFQKNKRATS
jgi:hypothetical protein